jgi:hypothetical protein
MFTTFATVFMLRACVLQAAEFFVLGVLFVFGAFLTKGLPGLFPLLVPFLYGIHDYRHGIVKGTVQTIIISALLCGFVTGLGLLVPTAGENILHYLKSEVATQFDKLNSSTLQHRGLLFLDLLKHLLPALMCLVAINMVRNKTRRTPVEARRNMRFFLTLAVLAAVPLLVLKDQPVQSLLPAVPLFAMAFGVSVLPSLQQSMEDNSISWRSLGFVFNTVAAVTLLTLCFAMYNHPTRYRTLLSDTEKISESVGDVKLVSCDWSTADDYQLNAYLQRKHRIALVGGTEYEFLLMKKSERLNPPDGYQAELVPLDNYVLYKKSNR